MRTILLSGIIVLALFFAGCGSSVDTSQLAEDLQENFDFGNFSYVISVADSLKKFDKHDEDLVSQADSLRQIAERTNLDFSLTEEQFRAKLNKLAPDITDKELARWDSNGWVEWRIIDGSRKYFNRAASNLILLLRYHKINFRDEAKSGSANDTVILHNTRLALNDRKSWEQPVVPVKMKITYSISVHAGAAKNGQMIRCWLPYPRNDIKRQQNINFLSASQPDYVISPDSATHKTIFMKQAAVDGKPTVFSISFTYTSAAQYFNLQDGSIKKYNTSSEEYLKYTSEELPHICFSDNVKELADSLSKGITDPVGILSAFYLWIKLNIPWCGAQEYSIIPNIPEYVIKNRHGDCGMQTFLFMSMLRYKGIPVRWQSGWEMIPDDYNLHDWCEVFFEGKGWIPVDVTYNLQHSSTQQLREYFMTGIDSYRFVVNKGVASELYPSKKYLRSEPYDFQRGEVETDSENLYFDKWDYDMKIEYLK